MAEQRIEKQYSKDTWELLTAWQDDTSDNFFANLTEEWTVGRDVDPNGTIQLNAISSKHVSSLTGDVITAGKIRSVNLSTLLGSEFNLNDGTFKLGGTSSPKLEWDGTTLSIEGAITVTGGDAFSKTTDDLDDIDNGTTYSKVATTDITAGHITVVSSSASININDTTFGNDGVQLQYNGGNPRAYIGNGSTRYFQFDGTDLSWAGANTSLTTAGAFTASNANITGAINSLSGGFGTGYNKVTIGTTGLVVNATQGIQVNSGYDISILKGGDINFYSDATTSADRSELHFWTGTPASRTDRAQIQLYEQTSAYQLLISASGASTSLKIASDGGIYLDDTTYLNGDLIPNADANRYIGDSSHRFETINFYHWTSPGYLYLDNDVEPAGTSGTKDLGTASKHFQRLYAYHLASTGDVTCDTHFVPNVDASYNLGYDTTGTVDDLYWNNIYLQNAPVVASTERRKDNIESLGIGMDFIRELNPIRYKHKNKEVEVEGGEADYLYKKEEGTDNLIPYSIERKSDTVMTNHDRFHWGLWAEQVKEVMDKLKITAEEFGGYCADENGGAKGLRYTEFIAPIIVGLKELDKRILNLEEGKYHG